MAWAVAVLAAVVVALVTGAGLRAVRARRQPPTTHLSEPPHADIAGLLLEQMPLGALVVDRGDEVVLANRTAQTLRVVRGQRLAVSELRRVVADTRRTRRAQDRHLEMPGAGPGQPNVAVRVRTTPMDQGNVAVVLEDVREALRVEAVRRDFAANVGHELKTPVGALSVLAEAALQAVDDPDAVHRFVSRIGREAQRLGRLIQELIELSRLQGADPLPPMEAVDVDEVLDEALDRTRAAAEAGAIDVVRGGEPGLRVLGDDGQLVTAIANIIDNAIAYSEPGDRVAVATRSTEDAVEVAVTDQGIGIAPENQTRIFERFYRVDPARSRATGGTGLGLAIVKHIVTNHGGEVKLWSELGQGSTFTVRLRPAGERKEPASTASAGRSGTSAAAIGSSPSPRSSAAARPSMPASSAVEEER